MVTTVRLIQRRTMSLGEGNYFVIYVVRADYLEYDGLEVGIDRIYSLDYHRSRQVLR